MGYNIDGFQGDVDTELICGICSGVLEDPLQAPDCEHAFCNECITEWLKRQSSCPVDRQTVTSSQCRPVPKNLSNLLSRLSIKCDNAAHGCSAVLKINCLASHLETCEYKSRKRDCVCEVCLGVIEIDELEDHNCVLELQDMLSFQEQLIYESEVELAKQRRVFTRQDRQLRWFSDRLYNLAVIFFLEIAIIIIFLTLY